MARLSGSLPPPSPLPLIVSQFLVDLLGIFLMMIVYSRVPRRKQKYARLLEAQA